MNNILMVIGNLLIFCVAAYAQVLHHIGKTCQGSPQEIEQRVLQEVKLHLHDFMNTVTRPIMTELTQTKQKLMALESSNQDLEQKYEKLDADFVQLVSDFASKTAESEISLEDMKIDLSEMKSDITILNGSLVREVGKRDMEKQKNQDLIVELEYRIEGVGQNFSDNLLEVLSKNDMISMRIEDKMNETNGTLKGIKGDITALQSHFKQRLDRQSDSLLMLNESLHESLSETVEEINQTIWLSTTELADALRRDRKVINRQLAGVRQRQADIKIAAENVENETSTLAKRVEILNNDFATFGTTFETKLEKSSDQMMMEMNVMRENDTLIMGKISTLFSNAEQTQASYTAISSKVQGMMGKQNVLRQLIDRINSNTYGRDITGLKSTVSNINTQIIGLKNEGSRRDAKLYSNYNTLNSRINSARSLANAANNFAKGISLRCSWTSYLNSYDRVMNYKAPSGYIIRGMYSVHHNGYEDRRFKFYICR